MKIEDTDAKQIVRSGAFEARRLVHWLGAGNRPLARTAADPPVVRGPKRLLVLAAAAAALGVMVLVFLGVIAVTLKVFESGVAPVLSSALGYVSHAFFRLVLMPGGLPILALAILAIGLPLAPKFRDPGQFARGLFGVSLALVCVWQLFPRLVALLPTEDAPAQLEAAPWLIVGFIISAFLFTGGVYLMGSANSGSANDGDAMMDNDK